MRRFDVAVIGMGAAGQKAAIQAAKLGGNVLAVERRVNVGGEVVQGSIPSKTLRESILYLTGARHRAFGLPENAPDRPVTLFELLDHLGGVLGRETAVMVDQLRRNGVNVEFGPARFAGDHKIEITTTGETVWADKVILTPGTVAARSKNVPVNGETIVDSDQLLSIREIPRSLIIVGAGVIGTEYAGIFAALGVRVVVIDQRAEFLEFVDREIIRALTGHMEKAGAEFRLGVTLREVRPVTGGAVAVLDTGEEIAADCVLYSVGRQGATADLGLESVGLQADNRGRLVTNRDYQTAIPYIYAAGDIIGNPALASAGMEQGRVAARAAMGAPTHHSDAGLMPTGIYSVPEISMVGRTEERLRADGVDYVKGVAPFKETARGQIVGDQFGQLKVLADRKTGAILGVHIIGESATELIHIGQAVMTFGGTFEYLVNTVFNYPTFAEAYKTAGLYIANQIWREQRV